MRESVLIELYLRGVDPVTAWQRMLRASLRVRNVGVSHIYVDVLAESDDEALQQVRGATGASVSDMHVVRSYLDDSARHAESEAGAT